MSFFGAICAAIAAIAAYLPIFWSWAPLTPTRWRLIEDTLNYAITDRRRIESLSDLREYFKEAGQDMNSLSSHWEEIFDSYNSMRVKASLQFPFVPDVS